MSGRKLPPTAYVIEEGQEYVPLTAGQTLTEFTFKAVAAGIVERNRCAHLLASKLGRQLRHLTPSARGIPQPRTIRRA